MKKKPQPAPKNYVSLAWVPFVQTLAAALELLVEDQYLILQVKHSNRFIQFAVQGAFGIRVETTSNHFLSKREKLNEQQITALMQAGWNAPSGNPDESTPVKDPDGSPNFYAEFNLPVSFEAVAELAVHTFAEILRVPHPGFLQYEAFDDTEEEWATMALPELGLKHAKETSPDDTMEKLATLLLNTLKEETGISELDYDKDGDIGIGYGSAVVFIRLIGPPAYIHIYSPILREVDECPDLYARLNEINSNETLMRFYYKNGVIYAATNISAVPYESAHVLQAYAHFCVIADGMDSLLQAEFGGKIMFAETMPSLVKH